METSRNGNVRTRYDDISITAFAVIEIRRVDMTKLCRARLRALSYKIQARTKNERDTEWKTC